MPKQPMLESLNVDGELVITFSSFDKNTNGTYVGIYHREYPDTVEIIDMDSIKKVRDFLTRCINKFEGREVGINNVKSFKPGDEANGRNKETANTLSK